LEETVFLFMMLRKFFFLLFFVSLILLFFQVSLVSANQVNAPTILTSESKRDIMGAGKPFFIGLTEANTEVLVYVNGTYDKMATVNISGTETDNFYYQYDGELLTGSNEFKFIARDKTSQVLSPPVNIEYSIDPLPAPTLVGPDEDDVISQVKPNITGLTVSNTLVHIYIDGVYNGKTETVKHNSGTADFVYKPFLNLAVGWHEVIAMAEDLSGNQSQMSESIKFRVREPMPAPTLFTPIVNNNTTNTRPFIPGLAKNDSVIKVFIDHKLDGEFRVLNRQSGSASFAYQPFLNLSRGNHLVYATATDNDGKESKWSNIIYFNVLAPAITVSAQEVKSETVAKIEEPVIDKESLAFISPNKGVVEGKPAVDAKDLEPVDLKESPQTQPEDPFAELLKKDESKDKPEDKPQDLEAEDLETIEQPKDQEVVMTPEGTIEESISDEDIKKIIEEAAEDEEGESGLISEDEKGISKLNINLIIFIAFLLGVIIWIFWVNRELIKERKKQNEQAEQGAKQEKADEIVEIQTMDKPTKR